MSFSHIPGTKAQAGWVEYPEDTALTPSEVDALLSLAHWCARRVEDWNREDAELADALSSLSPEDRDSAREERDRQRIAASRARAVFNQTVEAGLR